MSFVIRLLSVRCAVCVDYRLSFVVLGVGCYIGGFPILLFLFLSSLVVVGWLLVVGCCLVVVLSVCCLLLVVTS